MNRKDFGIILGMMLVVALWIGWVMTQYEKPNQGASSLRDEERDSSVPLKQESSPALPPTVPYDEIADPLDVVSNQTVSVSLGGLAAENSDSFPAPTVEVVHGRAERTIHMGVRQYAWDPSVILVKQGELVRLIVHNADVQHGLVIPDLNVLNIDIPPEGAVIEFVASKTGTFVFFCSYYCGEGHSEMRGKIIVE